MSTALELRVEYFRDENRKFWSSCEYATHSVLPSHINLTFDAAGLFL